MKYLLDSSGWHCPRATQTRTHSLDLEKQKLIVRLNYWLKLYIFYLSSNWKILWETTIGGFKFHTSHWIWSLNLNWTNHWIWTSHANIQVRMSKLVEKPVVEGSAGEDVRDRERRHGEQMPGKRGMMSVFLLAHGPGDRMLIRLNHTLQTTMFVFLVMLNRLLHESELDLLSRGQCSSRPCFGCKFTLCCDLQYSYMVCLMLQLG